MKRSSIGLRRAGGRVGAAGVAALCLTLVACGGGSKDTTATTTAAKSSTTTAPTSVSTTVAGAPDAWQVHAEPFRGQNGTTHDVTCTPGGTARSVWGTGTYTDDSSVCTAAVQSGLVTFAQGGTVTFEIAAGRGSYDGGTANGVTSQPYGSFAGSFTFPKAPPGSVEFAVGPDSWSRSVAGQNDQPGSKVAVACAPGGTAGSVWGSGPYTADSSVCTAAVQAGLITLADGGKVIVEMAAGQDSYKGSTANGITSKDYGSFNASFTFPTDQTTS